ncbi:hypothetical protein MC885_006151 [Smutsia gigantea]|nr:hypothetical protein MC885_006151 [Smutsia gigantea]
MLEMSWGPETAFFRLALADGCCAPGCPGLLVGIGDARLLYFSCRSFKRNDPVNPYHVGSGYVFAPATSANDSEISSDALTDDSMSMTDSSVDGIPPYRVGSKKQLQREMHRSVKANGQVSLPHFPRTHRLPKEMTPVEPATFAAELISRLEKLKLELDSRHSLEERLQQIREVAGLRPSPGRSPGRACVLSRRPLRLPCQDEEEGSERALSPREGAPAPHPLSLLPSGSCEEDPQTILDDHLSRVLQTPGCQSPGVGRCSPGSCSPDHHHQPHHPPLPPGGRLPPAAALPAGCPLGARGFVTKQTTKHVHHHYIHHHAVPKTKEEIEAEATQRAHCLCPGGADYYCYSKCKSHPRAPDPVPAEQLGSRGSALPKRSGKGMEPGLALPAREGGAPGGAGALQLPGEEGDRSQDVWQWMLESERQSKPKPHSAQSMKKAHPVEPARTSVAERASRHHLWGGSSGHPRAAPRAHPFTQDPAMPPLTPPNTLAQLEEACRRLAEVSKPPKQRCCAASQQKDRNHSAMGQAGATPFSSPILASEDHKEPKKLAGVPVLQASELVVTYFFCGEEIPYRRMLKAPSLTLGHFKEQLSKKGNYRYYFKKASDEFACGAVFEEIWDDETVLPMYEGRILGKVERID